MDGPVRTCTACGACCVTFPVAFRCREIDTEPGGWVPAAYVDGVGLPRACMRGTREPPRRCVALEGVVGVDVRCAIYDRRPSPCRAFAPDAAVGCGDAACGDARRLLGMPPLAGSYDAFPVG